MKLVPLGDRVMVTRSKEDTTSKSGLIYIPDTAQEKPAQGTVVAVGPGFRNKAGDLEPIPVSSGDTILFGKYAGTETKIEGQEFVILRTEEIIGKLVKK